MAMLGEQIDVFIAVEPNDTRVPEEQTVESTVKEANEEVKV